mgnify:CR=1 FL=1|jgi:hypothetical protein
MGQISRWVDPPWFGGETPKCKGKQVLKSSGLQVLGSLGKTTPSPIVGRTYAR